MKQYIILFVILALFFGGPLYVLFSNQLVLNQHWSQADRSSANIAPDPLRNQDKAIVQIYAARTYGWRGMFAVHTWIAIKPKNAKSYTVYQLLGWNLFRGLPALSVTKDIPDRIWFGHRPWVIYEAIGKPAEKNIEEIQKAVQGYPYKNAYQLWPGPNSNTFIAYVIRHTPSIQVRLPLTAIGKDYFTNGPCGPALSGTGIQCSLKGVIGLTLAKIEGVEIDLLGFNFSINAAFPFIHLPGID